MSPVSAPVESVGIITWFRKFITNRIPEGYQDENGFHFGPKVESPGKPSFIERAATH